MLPIVGFLPADDRRCFALCNDVGLLSEECGVQSRRFRGNFPQALSHTSLIRSAMTLSGYGDDLAGRPHSGRLPNRRGLRGYPDDI